jgi:hypothetical protein
MANDNYWTWFFLILSAELVAEFIIMGAKHYYPKIKKVRKRRNRKAKVLRMVSEG